MFFSSEAGLIPSDTTGWEDVYVKDLQTGTATLLSVSSSGSQAYGGYRSSPSASGDGQYVVFDTNAGGLVSPDPSIPWQVNPAMSVECLALRFSVRSAVQRPEARR